MLILCTISGRLEYAVDGTRFAKVRDWPLHKPNEVSLKHVKIRDLPHTDVRQVLKPTSVTSEHAEVQYIHHSSFAEMLDEFLAVMSSNTHLPPTPFAYTSTLKQELGVYHRQYHLLKA